MSCDALEPRGRLLSTALTFHVRGSREAISSLVEYLTATVGSYRTAGPGGTGPFGPT